MLSPALALPVRRARIDFVARLASHGDAPALLDGGQVLTYAALADRVAQAAEALGGDRRLVLIATANEIEAVVQHLACLWGGHVPLLVPADQPHAVAGLIAAYDPDVVVRRGDAEPWRVEHRRAAPAYELHPDLALLLTTSGSTGSPKVVRLSHENVQSNAAGIAQALGITSGSRAITTLPLAYSYGLSVLHSHLQRGASVVLTDRSVTEAAFWDLLRASRATSFAAVPYTFDLLDRVGFERMHLPDLHQITQAGGKLAPERVRRFAQLGRRQGWDLRVMYGQTEATARMACLPAHQACARPSAIGHPLPGGELRLADVRDGVGELVYTGPNVMLGYAETPADLGLGRTVHELRTGDLARATPDGDFEIVGRASRVAKVFGNRIDLQHLEHSLAAQGITACCLEDEGGLLVAAQAPADPLALREAIADLTALPPRVVRVHGVDALPRLPSGKPDLLALADLARRHRPSTPEGPDDLPALYADALGRREVDVSRSFAELGGDSLSYVELSVRLEQALGRLPAQWHTRSIADLAESARRATPGRRSARRIETSVLLRALAIVLIVGSHVDLFDLSGGSHVLLAVAGYNVARFCLTAELRGERVRRLLRATGRLAIPTVAWVAFAAAVSDDYGVLNVLLLNGLLGPPGWSSAWHYWFLEALVALLLAVAALLLVPAVHRWDRRRPLAVPSALLALGALLRWFTPSYDDNAVHTVAGVLWLFALGWAGARAQRRWHRVALTLSLLVVLPGYFTDGRRAVFVAAGVAALLWLPTVRCPSWLSRPLAVLAGASLYVYVTHWLVYPGLEDDSRLLAFAASFAVGLAYWQLCGAAGRALRMTGITLPRRCRDTSGVVRLP